MENHGTEVGGAIRHIVVCGGGLAAWMSACALRSALPSGVKITLIDIASSDEHDIFYGTVSPPTSYNFNLSLGVSEPDLLLNTETSFSYGTRYENWDAKDLSWSQCHHLPFPVFAGLPFTHIVCAHGDKNLKPYLASAQAGQMGRFIHPPKDPSNPMSRAEYGYQFNSAEWRNIFRQTALDKDVEYIKVSAVTVNRTEDTIKNIRLPGDRLISADLYVDCSGPNSKLTDTEFSQKNQARLGALSSEKPAANLGPPMRRVKAAPSGWTSETYLKDRVHQLTIFDEDDTYGTGDGTFITAGRQSHAWVGNCVAIGHTASVIEPLTPAPIMLLQRDIERLLTLIPITTDMTIEAQAYNQTFADDYQHALIFNQAFFAMPKSYSDAYWIRRQSSDLDEKLKRKLTQFESRGLHVAYDLEPFNEQDWAILNFGMQRKPKRVDVFAKLQDHGKIDQQLVNIRQTLMRTVEKMPPHHIYMDKLLSYLKRKQGSHV